MGDYFRKKSRVEKQHAIIPNERRNYLREVVKTIRSYHHNVEEQAALAQKVVPNRRNNRSS